MGRQFFKLILALALLVCSSAFADTHYFSLTGGNIPPYTNWATAANVIQDAIDAAANGDTVLVTNGVYRSTVVSNTIHLISVSGPYRTAINGQGSNSCVILSNSASITGFTLTGGYSQDEGCREVCQDCVRSLTTRLAVGRVLSSTVVDTGEIFPFFT